MIFGDKQKVKLNEIIVEIIAKYLDFVQTKSLP